MVQGHNKNDENKTGSDLKGEKEGQERPAHHMPADDNPNQGLKNGQDQQKAALNKRVEDLTDTLQRLQAEFDNYRKRLDREKQECINYASSRLVEKLLPILDSIELALKNDNNKEQFDKGVKLIFAQLHTALRNEGLCEIDAVGKPFDPYRHEVLMKVPSKKPDDTVVEELQKGYLFKDRVLRHTKVNVSRHEDNKRDSAPKGA